MRASIPPTGERSNARWKTPSSASNTQLAQPRDTTGVRVATSACPAQSKATVAGADYSTHADAR